jgi:hypothetical protein
MIPPGCGANSMPGLSHNGGEWSRLSGLPNDEGGRRFQFFALRGRLATLLLHHATTVGVVHPAKTGVFSPSLEAVSSPLRRVSGRARWCGSVALKMASVFLALRPMQVRKSHKADQSRHNDHPSPHGRRRSQHLRPQSSLPNRGRLLRGPDAHRYLV